MRYAEKPDHYEFVGREGYMFEDMDQRGQDVIRAMGWVLETVEDWSYPDMPPKTLRERLTDEIVEEAKRNLITHIECEIAEHQISYIENMPEEADNG